MREIINAIERLPELVGAASSSSKFLEELAAIKEFNVAGLDASKTAPSILQVRNDLGVGSGFVVDKELVATADHVVSPKLDSQSIAANNKITLGDGSSLPARVVLRSTNEDLALLHVPGLGSSLSPIKYANQAELKAGDSVHVAGFDAWKNGIGARSGIFSHNQIGPSPNYASEHPAIWSNSKISDVIPGFSGGPLFDKTGLVNGVAARSSGTNLFASDSAHLTIAHNELQRGLPENGWIDFGTTLAETADRRGLTVQRLFGNLKISR